MTTQRNGRRRAQEHSVEADQNVQGAGFASIVLNVASAADEFQPWGGANQKRRDDQLRRFWPTESVLASAVYSTAARDSAFSWTLEGPPNTVARLQQMLQESDEEGWQGFILKVATDRYTQDNGAFIEIIRAEDSANAPVIGIGHLDSSRCTRTGNFDEPVIYMDLMNRRHLLKWFQVKTFTDFPSPIKTMRGVQFCAVSRVLRAAQLLKSVSVYQLEKVSGRNPSSIHLISGIDAQMIEDASEQTKNKADEEGYSRYQKPIIFSTIDPTAAIGHVEIPYHKGVSDADAVGHP